MVDRLTPMSFAMVLARGEAPYSVRLYGIIYGFGRNLFRLWDGDSAKTKKGKECEYKSKTDVKGSLSYAVHLLPPFSVMPHKGSMADGSVTVSRNVKRPHGMKKIWPASFRLRFSPPLGCKDRKDSFRGGGFCRSGGERQGAD